MTMTHTGIQSLDFDVPVVMVSLPYGPIEKCRLALPANRIL